MNTQASLPCVLFGASGYTGVELAKLICGHPKLHLHSLFVSENSVDAGKPLSQLYPVVSGLIDQPLMPANTDNIESVLSNLQSYDKTLIFLATPHEFSHDIAASLMTEHTQVFDLSGAFRLKDTSLYTKHYGYLHKNSELTLGAPYGLPEWNAKAFINAPLISLPGCYPTAAQLALKPLIYAGLLANDAAPVINAVSGVSGAGRKANLATSFCELSLKPYQIFCHRHSPEIEQELGRSVIFTPHIANFARGILATITVKVKNNTYLSNINHAFDECYHNQPLVRLRKEAPAINDVAHTPFCDLYWQLYGEHLIIISAIDNLLKGAASQAIQCANLASGWPQQLGLLPALQSISDEVKGVTNVA